MSAPSAVSAPVAGISIREFARRSGLDDKQVRRGLENGDLVALSDGLLDPALVGTDWRRSVRHRRPAADKGVDTPRTHRVVRSEVRTLATLSASAGNPPPVVGLGERPMPPLGPWQAPTTIYSSTGLPTDVVDLASHIDGGASDMAIVLLRGGLTLDLVEPLVAAWVTEMRYGHTNVLDGDDPDAPAPPYGFERWAYHPLFVRDWMDDMGTSWEELQEEAAQPPRRFG